MVAVPTIVEIHRGYDEAWQRVWQQVHAAHETAEGFRGVRLLQDADHAERYVVLSEWEDRAHYSRFIRHIGLPWLQDTWEYSARPSTVMFLQDTAADSGL